MLLELLGTLFSVDIERYVFFYNLTKKISIGIFIQNCSNKNESNSFVNLITAYSFEEIQFDDTMFTLKIIFLIPAGRKLVKSSKTNNPNNVKDAVQLYAESAAVCRTTIITLAGPAALQQIKYVRKTREGDGATKFRTRDKDKLNQHEIMSV